MHRGDREGDKYHQLVHESLACKREVEDEGEGITEKSRFLGAPCVQSLQFHGGCNLCTSGGRVLFGWIPLDFLGIVYCFVLYFM